jgi:hypothetical protein
MEENTNNFIIEILKEKLTEISYFLFDPLLETPPDSTQIEDFWRKREKIMEAIDHLEKNSLVEQRLNQLQHIRELIEKVEG